MAHNNRRLLYLDQNFLSNLAKVENLPDWKDGLRPFWVELLKELRILVVQNKLICPTASFHREESEQGRRVEKTTWIIAEDLSDGVSFRHEIEVYHGQLVAAALAYCRKVERPLHDWKAAFTRDPQSPRTPNERAGVRVYVPFSQEWVEYGRQTKNLANSLYGDFKQALVESGLGYNDLVSFLKYQLLRETFALPPKLTLDNSELNDFVNVVGVASTVAWTQALLQALQQCNDLEGFLRSDHLLGCPYLHIRAALMAADICYYPTKAPTRSLSTDFDMVATVLPNVDMLVTDSYITDLIARSGLSKTFPAKVYAVKHREELLRALKNL